jgi:glycosyltransferase involved in cell wall biosynthesis
MKKKVLVVGSSLEDKGGIVTVMDNISRSINNEKFQLDWVETYITGSKLKRVMIFLKGLMLFIYKMFFQRPNLVHIHMSYNGSFYRKSIFVLICKMIKLPVIVHVHGSTFKDFYKKLNSFQVKYCHYILNNTDQIIVLSIQWKDFFSSFVDPNKIFVLYNGVQQSGFKKTDKNNVPVCLFLGRLGERKGIYDLLKAIKHLKDKGVKAEFWLAGDGEVEKVNNLIKDYGIEKSTRTLGWINGLEKKELLQKADVLALPSYNEGLPMAILEAMDYGLAIISTPVGGIPEVIKADENGYLVNVGNTTELAEALAKVIEDDDLRALMGINNKKKIEKQFNLNVLIKDLEMLYNKILFNK